MNENDKFQQLTNGKNRIADIEVGFSDYIVDAYFDAV